MEAAGRVPFFGGGFSNCGSEVSGSGGRINLSHRNQSRRMEGTVRMGMTTVVDPVLVLHEIQALAAASPGEQRFQ